MDICSQADRLDRKLEQLLLCLAEHLADHDGEHQDHGRERTESPVDGAVGEGDLPHAHEGKGRQKGAGPSRGWPDCGCFAPRQIHAEKNYHLRENRMRSDTQCPTTKRG